MRDLLRKLFGRQATPGPDESESAEDRARCDSPEDFNWMFPPSTVTDAAAWDRYWQDQLSHGVAGFIHLFVDDGELVDAMRANGLRTVLCVGNGISQEPRALAWAGFDVISLDISPWAAEVAADAAPPDDFLARLVGGSSTLQLWPEADRPMAMRAVANRLASRGIFFSQSHNGGWRPPAPRKHALEPWFVAEGWEFWRGNTPLTGRVAWLFTTTG